MRKLFLVLIVVLLIFPSSSAEQEEIMYIEKISAYTIIDHQSYRWNLEREFLFQSYSVQGEGENKTATIYMLTDFQQGSISNITQKHLSFNFEPEVQYLENGSLQHVEWSILLTRDAEEGATGADPFTRDQINLFTKSGNRRYDLRINQTYFSVNLQYYEFMNNSNHEFEKIKTNTELTTNNNEDGTLIRSAVHIIKRRTDAEIIFEYDWSIQKVSTFHKVFNWFDQPKLWVPYRIAAILAAIYLYMLGYRYVSRHEITIKPKETEK
ncbi:MAG: hypothetical protein INQ03_08615 [Candidatus Heimdallarchaeota archaeon]|nr:hypothetical protein [Candidatus Heimdallarchaeota archaeon]